MAAKYLWPVECPCEKGNSFVAYPRGDKIDWVELKS